MNKTNCVNCGAPVNGGKCGYCGTHSTLSNNHVKDSSNAPVKLSTKTKLLLVAFLPLSPLSVILYLKNLKK